MTDVFRSDDELISSYLDGEATPVEIVHVESSPDLVARAADLRAAILLTATPVDSLEVSVVDHMVTAALDAGGVPHNVTDLTAAKPRSLPKAILVAAAVVLVALAVPAVKLINRSSGVSDLASAPAAVAASTIAPSLDGGPPNFESLDNSSAATTSTAAAATTAAPSLDFAPADLAESAGAARSEIAPGSAQPVIPGLPPVDRATFDPLPNVLSAVPDLTSLREVLIAALSDDVAPTPGATGGTIAPDLDPFLCAGALGDFLASNPVGIELANPAAVTDNAQITIAGTVHWLSLVRISPTRVVALVVDATTCSPVTLINVIP